MKKLLLLVTAFLLYGTLFAQTDPCGYDVYRQHLIEEDSNNLILYHLKKQWVEKYRQENPSDTTPPSQPSGQIYSMGMGGGSCPPAKYIIPVVVHIVHQPSDNSPGTGTNISDAQVHHQINLLNQHFSPSGIQFCLVASDTSPYSAKGIERHSSALSSHNMPGETQTLFNTQYLNYINGYPSENYLNIYVVETILNDNGVDEGVIGYATIPGGAMQGVVVRHNFFGNFATCSSCTLDSSSTGISLTHEVGHYLGLEHTFFGGCVNADSCSKSGDLCCDTPPCVKHFGCDTVNTCNETYNGDLDDPRKNYMSYSGQACQVEFTLQQIEIMYAVLENSRSSLFRPKNLNAIDLECCFFSALFSTDKTFLCKQLGADTVKFEAFDYENASYYWAIRDSSGTLITSHTDSIPYFYHVFDTTIGKYSVYLEITLGGDQTSNLQYALIEMADCGNPLASTQGSWLFGKYAGLLFTDKGVIRDIEPSLRLPNAINTSEGTISVSDSNGVMLFHGGGLEAEFGKFHLFDRNYDTMPHNQVTGDGSSAQGGLVVPVQGQTDRYYLFTTSARTNKNLPITFEGLRYSIIDLSFNSGNGDVDTNFLNVPVKAASGAYPNPNDSALMSGEGINSIPRCSSPDTWIITMGVDDSTVIANGAGEAYLYVYLLDSSGIHFHSKSPDTIPSFYATVKVSPNGAFVMAGDKLYRFDRSNGILTAQTEFSTIVQAPIPGYSFSPDSKILYLIGNDQEYPAGTVYQADLGYFDPARSLKAIGTVFGLTGSNNMQIGPDGKIYINLVGQSRLAVINQPNIRVSANGSNECGFSTEGPILASGGVGGICNWGLPSFSDANISDNYTDFTFTDSACGNFKFYAVTCSVNNKWYFGDGDSSLSVNASHSYSSIGNYTVVLISGADTVSKLVSIGVEKPLITGDSIVCDSSTFYAYSLGNICQDCEYTWDVSGGDFSPGSNPYEIFVDWNNASGVSLLSVNQRNGCRDSSVFPVSNRYFIVNNIEDSNQFVCANSIPPVIHGSKPSAGNFTFSYQWKISVDSLNWQDIPGATSMHLQPDSLRDTVKYFLRVVYLADCDTFYSNVTKRIPDYYQVSNNSINVTEQPIFKGCSFEITGSVPVINNGATPIYSWYYAIHDTDWTQITPGSWAQKDLNFTLNDVDSFYVFRKVGASSCVLHSDTLKVKADVIITKNPIDYYTCNNRVYFNVGYNNPQSLAVIHTWIFNDTPALVSPDGIYSTVNSSLLDRNETSFFGDYYACQLSYSSCTVLSEWARYDRSPDTLVFFDNIWLSDTLINEWDTALAIVWDSTVIVDSGAYVRQYIWQKSTDGVNFSDIFSDSAELAENNNDTFWVADQRACEWYAWYRVRLRAAEDCPFAYSSSTPGIRTTTNAHLMMRDYYDDNGAEPNDTTDWRNLYDPPSLLIRLSADGGTVHETPDWVMNDTAYVYYTIRNVGTDISKPAKLKMYWTFGGPHGADWSLAWQDVSGNRFYNDDPGSGVGVYHVWHPYGDFINEIPIEVPSIAPGDSIRSYFPWGDFPNPMRYYVWQNNIPEYSNPRIMCLLARVETCPEDSFGLARQETTATRQNIINNSRIVGRNTSVTNVQWQFGKKEVELTVRRFAGDDLPVRVTFEEVGNCGFGSYGRVKAVLSDALWEAWKDGGYVGSGYSIDSYGILSVTNLSGFELENIDLDADSVSLLTFEFELTSNPFVTLNCRYAVAQYQGETSLTPYGTFVMNVNAIGEPEEGGLVVPVKEPIATEQDPTVGFTEQFQEVKTESSEQETGSEENTYIEKSLFAYPNPFTNEVNFYFELAASQNVGFEIYNSLGMVVGRINAREYAKGKHKVMFDGSGLAPGMYLCRVQIGTETKTLNLVIAR